MKDDVQKEMERVKKQNEDLKKAVGFQQVLQAGQIAQAEYSRRQIIRKLDEEKGRHEKDMQTLREQQEEATHLRWLERPPDTIPVEKSYYHAFMDMLKNIVELEKSRDRKDRCVISLGNIIVSAALTHPGDPSYMARWKELRAELKKELATSSDFAVKHLIRLFNEAGEKWGIECLN